MNPYADIDSQIRDWAERYRLILQRRDGPEAARWVWLSSEDGECFQIWIERPEGGKLNVGIACIEGRGDDEDFEHPEFLETPVETISTTLDEAYKIVVHRMRPSTHHHPIREQ